MGERAEEWDSFSNQHGHTSDDETLNESGAQEALNGDAAVDVGVSRATRSQFRNYLRGITGHLLDAAPDDC